MMPPMKQEPIEDPPDTKTQNIELLPDIKSETSPSKRLKTLTSDSPSKGKSKIVKEEDDDDSLPQQEVSSCGVCLLDEGMSLRGFIDSCDHYFCFVCIMEWAKIESRCPICKRRFSSITRPPKDGVFFSQRVVNVPVRDQIYYFNGNATVGPPDPYSETKCSVCCDSSDDHLLLLCDLCDSAAHSYCVGLGNIVPDGDWFCKDCALSRDEHAKVETDTTSDHNNSNNNDNILPSGSDTERSTCPEVSIHDIVRESSVNRSELTGVRSNAQSTGDPSSAPNARTLQRCLNVHSRIRVLRENWEGFRGGALNFSSTFKDGLKTSQSQSTSLNHESTSQNHPYDINRAWKMMDIAAKALGKKPGINKSVPKESVFLKKKERLLNEASIARPNSNYFGGLKKNGSEISSSRKIIACADVKNNRYMCQNLSAACNVVGSSDQSSSITTDKRFATKVINAALEKRENIRGSENVKSEIQSLVNESENSSSRKIAASAQVKNNLYNCQNLSTASNVAGSSDQSKKPIDATLEKKDAQFDGSTKEIENAKSEIQSLVKLNLKLLSRDKKLEADVFKEVARHATHSIMAACGIEPPKARFRSFERLVCDHSQTRKRPSSTLMPTCCRECFFTFVKDVVNTIAFDRTTSCKALPG